MHHRLLSTLRNLGLGALFALGAASASAQEVPCPPTTWDLTAGQTNVVGTVTVSNDLNNLFVTYTLSTPGATFGTLHAWVGNNLAQVPANPQGTPVPGHFPYKVETNGATTHTFTIPFTTLGLVDAKSACNTPLYVVTHAEVDLDGIPGGGHETAWGGPTPGSGPRWWFHGLYTICCDFGEPPVGVCDTAFAKGGFVFTTDRKSNPENLPSLGLTRNRWGWAIKLMAPGSYAYDLWAGAGLNSTANGTKVGKVEVIWDGANALVTYTVTNAAYRLSEAHLYAGDEAPATIAPGQYGNTAYFNYEYTAIFNVPLVDSNANGAWIVAHAVVCR